MFALKPPEMGIVVALENCSERASGSAVRRKLRRGLGHVVERRMARPRRDKATTVKEPCSGSCYTQASVDSDILIAKWSDGVQLPIAGVTVGFARALEAGAGNRKGVGEVAEVFSGLSIRPRFTK